MKHLDVYARRDVQLAPYLLRDIDIEYKRKCRKVSFIIWIAVLTLSDLFNGKLENEQIHYMKMYSA